jgi:hypothetical protein
MPVTITTIGAPQRITLKNDETVLNPNEIPSRKSSKRESERERKSEKRQSEPPAIRNTQDFITSSRQPTRNSRQAQQKMVQNIQRAQAIPGKIKQDVVAFENIHGPVLVGVKESITSGLSQIGTIITTPFIY